jgi:uncharacterized membrane protein
MIKKILKFLNSYLIIQIIVDIIFIFTFGYIVTVDIYNKRIVMSIIDIIFLILSVVFLHLNLRKVLKK